MTGPIQPESKLRSRRALLAGVLGGLGAWAATAVGRSSPVRAGVDGDVVLGAGNSATARTSITNFQNDTTVFWAESATDLGGGGGIGVEGSSDSGHGVNGRSATGVGLYGTTTSGLALQTVGRAKFSTSGVATINAGNISVTVTPGVNVTSGSFVLLTPKANIGTRALWFTTDATHNKFTIRMSSSRSSGTRVAWLLLG
jgi:hypothetical protein